VTIVQLFDIPPAFAAWLATAIIAGELGLAVVIWWRIPRWLPMVPVFFAGVVIFSMAKNIDCGCFGRLPLLSRMSTAGHLILLAGMFVGLLYLSRVQRQSVEEQHGNCQEKMLSGVTQWMGVAAIIAMLLPLGALPIQLLDTSAAASLATERVGYEELTSAIADDHTAIIDARPAFQYEFGHIPGAINIPYNSEDIPQVVDRLSLRDKYVIVYCSGPHCNVADLLAEKLRLLGCVKLKVYAEGWRTWREKQRERSDNMLHKRNAVHAPSADLRENKETISSFAKI